MGLPWLDQPVMLHSSRMFMCELTPEQCAYQTGYWRFWYEADRRYALPTVAFVMAFIFLFAVIRQLALRLEPGKQRPAVIRKSVALYRYWTYRDYGIPALRWISPSLGVLLIGAVGIIYFFSMTLGPRPYYWPNTQQLSYGGSPPLATRTGWMAIALLPFIVILATKANLITLVTGVSHEKLQVFHRWFSYAMFILALLHTFPFIVYNIKMGTMVSAWKGSIFYWSGVAALIPQAWLTFASASPLRNKYYEFFKIMHFVAALLFVFFLFLHCDYTLTSWDYFIVAGSLYFASLLYSQTRMYLGFGFSQIAELTLLENGMVEASITIDPDDVARSAFPVGLHWKAGQHVFVRFRGAGAHTLTMHPFTICSLPPLHPSSNAKPEMRLLVAPQKGFTGRLASIARERPGSNTKVLLEGPYGGLQVQTLAAFDGVFLVAGGSGSGFTLPLIEDVLRNTTAHSHTCEKYSHPPTKLHVMVSSRVPTFTDWYQSEVRRIVERYLNSPVNITLNIHLTASGTSSAATLSPASEKVAHLGTPADEAEALPDPHTSKPSMVVHITQGRPDVPASILAAAKSSTGSIGIAVCGPSSMLRDVREAASQAQLDILSGKSKARGIYLHSEHFSW